MIIVMDNSRAYILSEMRSERVRRIVVVVFVVIEVSLTVPLPGNGPDDENNSSFSS